MKEGGEFSLELFDKSRKLIRHIDSNADNFYNKFNQVSIHGGYPYYIDNLKVETIVE